MKRGDFYQHFKGTEYYYDGIALPYDIHQHGPLESIQIAYNADTPEGEELHKFNLYDYHGITLIDSEYPHVIYQSEKDYDTDKVWARKVDDFFGYKVTERGRTIQRFVKK